MGPQSTSNTQVIDPQTPKKGGGDCLQVPERSNRQFRPPDTHISYFPDPLIFILLVDWYLSILDISPQMALFMFVL